MGSDVNAVYIGETDPGKVIVELCRQFWDQGWMPGTAGAMSILDGPLIYVTPSGVQKERMKPQDLVVQNFETHDAAPNSTQQYKPSASAAVFELIYRSTGTKACIHTHSKNAVLASILPQSKTHFTISSIENIKAVPKYTEPGNLGFADTLRIPIIENQAHEEELVDELEAVLRENPGAPAILVRRHGLYVWGKDVWKAKIVNEALEYVMEVGVEMHRLGL